MVCAEACATGLRVDRRCESPLSNQAVVVVTDREGTKVPDAHVSIESLETGKKWYMDTDRTGAVRVNLERAEGGDRPKGTCGSPRLFSI